MEEFTGTPSRVYPRGRAQAESGGLRQRFPKISSSPSEGLLSAIRRESSNGKNCIIIVITNKSKKNPLESLLHSKEFSKFARKKMAKNKKNEDVLDDSFREKKGGKSEQQQALSAKEKGTFGGSRKSEKIKADCRDWKGDFDTYITRNQGVRLSAFVTRETFEKINRMAARLGVSRSRMTSAIIDMYLEGVQDI